MSPKRHMFFTFLFILKCFSKPFITTTTIIIIVIIIIVIIIIIIIIIIITIIVTSTIGTAPKDDK